MKRMVTLLTCVFMYACMISLYIHINVVFAALSYGLAAYYPFNGNVNLEADHGTKMPVTTEYLIEEGSQQIMVTREFHFSQVSGNSSDWEPHVIRAYPRNNFTSYTYPLTSGNSTTGGGWAATYGGANGDSANSIQQTSDSGYIVAGGTNSFGTGNSDAWLLKLDGSGNVKWQKTFGESSWDISPQIIQQTNDGGYILAASRHFCGSVWLLKLDTDGNVVWQKGYGSCSTVHSIQQTSDGGYIVGAAGGSGVAVYGWSDLWVFKLDARGNIIWQKLFGGSSWDEATSIQQTSDGGYIVAGMKDGGQSGTSGDLWILRLNANGAVVWQKKYGGQTSLYDSPRPIWQTNDGGFIVATTTNSFGSGKHDLWVLKLDTDGGIVWQKTYGGVNDDSASSIQQISDGGYIVAGWTKSFGAGSSDAWLLKLDGDGNIQWQKTYGEINSDSVGSIQQTSDGGYIAAGSTKSFGVDSGDFWVLKLGSDGTIYPVCSLIIAGDTSVSGIAGNATVVSTSVNGVNSSVTPKTTNAKITNTSVSVNIICNANEGVTPTPTPSPTPPPSTIVQTITAPSSTTVSSGKVLGPFSITESNNGSSYYNFYAQPYVIKPDGTTVSFSKISTGLNAGETRKHSHYLNIPVASELGTFTFGVKLTDTSGSVLDNDSFTFTVKSGSSAASRICERRLKRPMNNPEADVMEEDDWKMIVVPEEDE